MLLILSGCALTPPNEEVCVKQIEGAFCLYMQEGPERNMSEEEWNEIGRLSMSAKAYGEIKKFILEACEKYDCKSIKEKLRQFEGRLEVGSIQPTIR